MLSATSLPVLPQDARAQLPVGSALRGVRAACGGPTPSGVRRTNLLYNEYIVYDEAQVKIRYMIKTNFQFHHRLRNR